MSENKEINWWKIFGIIAIVLTLFLTGIYVGKKTTKPKIINHTEYITLPPIHDTLPPTLVTITKPVDTANLIKQCVADGIYQELFPEKIVYLTDTTTFTKPDSTTIMVDWATKRDYTATLFDIDTVGVCKVNTSVQYNRLGLLEYDFTPVQKQTTTTVTQNRKYIPYMGAGLSTFPSASIEAGMLIDQSLGFSLEGRYNYNPNKIPEIPKFDISLKVLKMF